MKIASLQYLRGLAALLVVLAHNSSMLEGGLVDHLPGALGVDIFFIISGFIMTFITHHATEKPALFILKRFFRIWPAFFVFWLLSYLIVYPERTFQHMACSLYFCLQDYGLPAPTFGYSALGPPWTLSYEIMFYVLFSVAMSISYRYRSYVCALFFIAASVGFQLFYNGHFELSSQVSPNLVVTQWWQGWIMMASNTLCFEFVAGMLLAEWVLAGKLPTLTPTGRHATGLALVLAVIGAGCIGPQEFGIGGGFWLALIIMTTVILLSHRHAAGASRPLMWLGDISYSLYLVHYSVMVFVSNAMPADASALLRSGLFVVSIAASFALAAAMFKWVEQPSIQAGKKLAGALFRRRAVPGAT